METKILLEDGLTPRGKPVSDCAEAVGHARAFGLMLETARSDSLTVTDALIKRLHREIYGGYYSGIADDTGLYRTKEADQVPARMAEYIEKLNQNGNVMHPVLLAACAFTEMDEIKPFYIGNGQLARLMMNLILVNRGYFPVSLVSAFLLNDLHETGRRGSFLRDLKKNAFTSAAFPATLAKSELEAIAEYRRMFRIREGNER